MCERIWRRLLAAAVGALALTGSASAQQITPPPATPPIAVALPALGPTAPTVPPAAVGVAARPHPIAGTVATATRGFVMEGAGGYYCSHCSTGNTCNSGCGSLRSDLGFVFGSCRSYFDPCGSRPLDFGHGGKGCFGHCRTPVLGRGSAAPYNGCTYDSYLNH